MCKAEIRQRASIFEKHALRLGFSIGVDIEILDFKVFDAVLLGDLCRA
jgi:hypothetical protein